MNQHRRLENWLVTWIRNSRLLLQSLGMLRIITDREHLKQEWIQLFQSLQTSRMLRLLLISWHSNNEHFISLNSVNKIKTYRILKLIKSFIILCALKIKLNSINKAEQYPSNLFIIILVKLYISIFNKKLLNLF